MKSTAGLGQVEHVDASTPAIRDSHTRVAVVFEYGGTDFREKV